MADRITPFPELISRRYLKSKLYGYLRARDFIRLRTYCMFIGYQRSGHSFIGALLDAHPNVAMGMEVDVLNLVGLGYSRKQICYILIRNSQLFRHRLKNVWTGYDYSVPGQFQGSYTELLMIGDKKGGKSTLRLGEDPALYTDLKARIGCRIRVLHVIRNPYDNISTMVLRHATDPDRPTREEIEDKIDLYFKKVGINRQLMGSGEMEVMNVYHESFIDDPQASLRGILKFLDLPVPQDYIQDCSRAVYREPHRTRNELSWPGDLKERIAAGIREVDFLRHYNFED